MKHLNAGLAAAAAAVVIALAAFAAGAASAATVGSKAPDFALPDASGTTHTLSQYKGKIVVLEWTNPQCPFVKRHYAAGTMKKLAAKYADQGVVWLTIDSSHFARPEDMRKWTESEGLKYPVLLDPSGATGQAYGAKTTPHMFVIDRDGKLVYSGAIDDDPRGENAQPRNYVDEVLAKLVKGEQPDVRETASYGCSVKYAKK